MAISIGIQGIQGSFHSIATQQIIQQLPSGIHLNKRTDEAYNLVEFDRFEHLCQALSEGKIDFATLAIENSLAGSLLPNYHLMLSYHLFASADVRIPIAFSCLVKQEVNSIEEIDQVISHPMAFHQCQTFFMKHPHLKKEEVFDTAGAAQIISQQSKNTIAALAPAQCAELFGLKTLESDIRDNQDNHTRFLFISKEEYALKQEVNRGILICKIQHNIGQLAKLLNSLESIHVQLTNIQSIPDHQNYGEYRFIFEFEVNNNLNQIKEVFQQHSSEIQYLASLP